MLLLLGRDADAGVFDVDWDGKKAAIPAHAPTPAKSGERISFVASPTGWLPDEKQWDLPRIVAAIDGAKRSIDVQVLTYGAHNRDGAIAAVEALADGFDVTGVTHLVIGVLAGRDPAELLDILDAEDAATVVCCTPDSPRALPAAELAALVSRAGGRAVVVDDIGDALQLALERADADDIVFVTGSLYTVGNARAALRERGMIRS